MNDGNGQGLRQRRTQAERSAATRQQICIATLDALAEMGSENVTTHVIANRAGISRGALTHQYPTRIEVLAAAYEFLIDHWRREFPFSNRPDHHRMTIEDFVDRLWQVIFDTEWYSAAIELMLASAKDDELGKSLRAILSDWEAERDGHSLRMLNIRKNDRSAVDFVNLTLSTLRGIALLRVLSNDRTEALRQVGIWKRMARESFGKA